MVVIMSKPILKGADQLTGTGPLLQPEAFLFQGAREALCVCVALRIVVIGEYLMALQDPAGLHECRRGRLAPVSTQQRHSLASIPLGELTIDGLAQRFQPWHGRASQARIVAHDHFRIPIAHDDDSDPAHARAAQAQPKNRQWLRSLPGAWDTN